MWDKRMASIYKDIFSLKNQERGLMDAVCIAPFFSVPPLLFLQPLPVEGNLPEFEKKHN